MSRRKQSRGIRCRLGIWLCVCLSFVFPGGCIPAAREEGQPPAEWDASEQIRSENPLSAQTPLEHVRVSAGGAMGQGTIWRLDEDRCVIVTAAHLVREGEPQIIWPDGTVAESRGTDLFEAVDTAFIRIGAENIPDAVKELCRAVKCAAGEVPEAGTEMTLKGLAEDGSPIEQAVTVKEAWIYTEDFGQHMLLTTGNARAGMSGAGLVDGRGCMAGMLCGAQEGENGSILAFVPVSVILTQWLSLDEGR